MKTQQEIQDMFDEAMDMQDFAGMSYKEGVLAALTWVLCQMDEEDSPVE